MKNGKLEHGDIIKVNLSPTLGHEQAGIRPALIVSNEFFNKKTNLILICPITSTVNNFPLHVKLENTVTKGEIKCEQLKAIDFNARPFTYIETVPKSILQEVFDTIFCSTELKF